MAKSKKAAGAKPIADVAHPGTTAPSDTSKPIITHRPMIKDPMMVEEPAENAETPPVKKSRETRITPPDESDKPKESVPAEKPADEPAGDKQEQEPEKKEEKTAPEPPAADPEPEKSEPAPEAPEPEPLAPADETETTDDNGKDEKDAKKSSKSKSSPDADTAASERNARTEKLISSKKYFLPINAVEHRRSRRVVIAGSVLAVLLALAWVNIALDAGIIEIDGIKPVTHFFSN